MRTLRPAGLVVVTAVVLTCCARLSSGDLTIQRDESVVSILADNQPVLRYRYGGDLFKAYVKELFTPAGVQILRDSPHDHVHHHGVMFAIFANGVDFWSENSQCGKQVDVELTAGQVQREGEIARRQFTQRLRWVPAGADQPLLLEQRTIEVYRGAPLEATLLAWNTELRPAKGAGTVKLTGTHYDGLGIRFVQSMDQVGRFQHAAAEPGPVVRGTERVTPATWCAYTAPADGKPVTVAIFDDPDNARHPAGMFTMLQPFSYLSATPNIWNNPLELKQDEMLTLRYGVALWDGDIGPDQIESLYQLWMRF